MTGTRPRIAVGRPSGRCRCWTNPPSLHDGHCCFTVEAPEECHEPLEEPRYITAHRLAILAGITYRQLDYWTRCGYLTPATDPKPGSGYARAYPRGQAFLAAQMRHLIEAGLTTPLSLVHETALQLLTTGSARLGDYTIHPRQETA